MAVTYDTFTFNGVEFAYTYEVDRFLHHITIPSIHYDEYRDDLMHGKRSVVMRAFVESLIRDYHENEMAKLKRWNESARGAV